MENVIIVAVLLVIVGLAARYIYQQKKKGNKCIGCPDGGSCNAKECGCSCGCNNTAENEQ